MLCLPIFSICLGYIPMRDRSAKVSNGAATLQSIKQKQETKNKNGLEERVGVKRECVPKWSVAKTQSCEYGPSSTCGYNVIPYVSSCFAKIVDLSVNSGHCYTRFKFCTRRPAYSGVCRHIKQSVHSQLVGRDSLEKATELLDMRLLTFSLRIIHRKINIKIG